MKLDDSCTSNPKSEISNWTVGNATSNLRFRNFGFEVLESSNFKISLGLLLLLFIPSMLFAQARGPAPRNPKDGALIDMTGYWVAIVSEDWRFRMLTPAKGDYPDIQPLNDAGKKIADAWDPAKDEAAGEQCKGYGAANIVRIPTRLRISWANDTTLKIEFDAGTQTRLLRFGQEAPAAGPPDWQGFSATQWEPPVGRGSGGSLKVVTTRMRPGYLQKNGVPYGANASMTEYFDIAPMPNGGGPVLLVTTIVDDPQYLNVPFIVSSQFKKEADGSKWDPTPCSSTW